jgi:hypothetical protein
MMFLWQLVEPFVGYLALALTALAAWWGNGKLKERKGRKEEEAAAKERDRVNAENIRNRVARDRDQRVRELDGRGYRD